LKRFTIVDDVTNPASGTSWFPTFIRQALEDNNQAWAISPQFAHQFTNALAVQLAQNVLLDHLVVAEYQDRYWGDYNDYGAQNESPAVFFASLRYSQNASQFPTACFTRSLGSCGIGTKDSSIPSSETASVCDIRCPTFSQYEASMTELDASFWCRTSDDCTPSPTDAFTVSLSGFSEMRFNDVAVPSMGYELPQVECVNSFCQTTWFSRFLGAVSLESQQEYVYIPQSPGEVTTCTPAAFFGGALCDEVPTLSAFASTSESLSAVSGAFTPLPGEDVSFEWEYTGLDSNLITIFVVVAGLEVQIVPVASVASNFDDATKKSHIDAVWPLTGHADFPLGFKVLNIDDTVSDDEGPTIYIRFLSLDHNSDLSSTPLAEGDALAPNQFNADANACFDFVNQVDLCQNGSCVAETGLCRCDSAVWGGTYCEINRCENLGCNAEGTSTCDLTNKKCSCKTGWAGLTCSEFTNCAANTEAFAALDNCNNRGTIATTFNAETQASECNNSKCQCFNSFNPADKCKTCQLNCRNGGRANKDCSTCSCPTGFFGEQCGCKASAGSIDFQLIPDFIQAIAIDGDATQSSFSQSRFNEWTRSLTASISYDLKLSSNKADNSVEIQSFKPVSRLDGEPVLRVEFVVYFNCATLETTSQQTLTTLFTRFATNNENFFSAIRNSRASIEAELPVVNPDSTFQPLACANKLEADPVDGKLFCPNAGKIAVPITDDEEPPTPCVGDDCPPTPCVGDDCPPTPCVGEECCKKGDPCYNAAFSAFNYGLCALITLLLSLFVL
jgi:hypothetical protein